MLLKARGVKTVRGHNQHSTANVESVAREAGVHSNTARNRLKLARDLEPYPPIREVMVVRGWMSANANSRKPSYRFCLNAEFWFP